MAISVGYSSTNMAIFIMLNKTKILNNAINIVIVLIISAIKGFMYYDTQQAPEPVRPLEMHLNEHPVNM